MAIYINSAAQISTQAPLDWSFFGTPKLCEGTYCRAIEAEYKQFIPPLAARRMGPLLKRAVATTVTSLMEAGVETPDAIICGTGLGCIENTEKFLSAMVENGETCLQPTFFINSTHNTIASQVATFLKCHGYNSTYAHLGISFESALLDAVLQFELGMVSNAVVGGHDEMTPTYYSLFDKVDYWRSPLGECSVSFVLDSQRKDCTLCRLSDVDLFFSSSSEEAARRAEALLSKHSLRFRDIDCIVTGRGGDDRYDGVYDAFIGTVGAGGKTECCYKKFFGESFTAPAYGLLVASLILSEGKIPEAYKVREGEHSNPCNILVVNCFKSSDWSFILLHK